MLPTKWIAASLTLALALGLTSFTRADPPAAQPKRQTAVVIELTYDLLFGQPSIELRASDEDGDSSSLELKIGCTFFSHIAEQIVGALLVTSPGLRAPEEEDDAAEQEETGRDRFRSNQAERRLPAVSDEDASEEQEAPAPKPDRRYRDMLRSTEPLEFVPLNEGHGA